MNRIITNETVDCFMASQSILVSNCHPLGQCMFHNSQIIQNQKELQKAVGFLNSCTVGR